MTLQVVVEGASDVPVATKLAEDAEIQIARIIDMGGKASLNERLEGFNHAAKISPWFVLRDLDQDAPCAPELLRKQRFRRVRWMAYRIAVHELEAWLLADEEAIADFLQVSRALVPTEPDAEIDPKRTLVNLARRSCRRALREGLVPAQGRAAVVGPLYQSAVIDFGQNHWNLHRAVKRSPSLRRAREALKTLSRDWRDRQRIDSQ